MPQTQQNVTKSTKMEIGHHPSIIKKYLKFIIHTCPYFQALKLTKSVSIDGLNGQVINLMSNDVARFDVTMGFVHDLWKGPIELALLGYFIYREIGFYGWIGIGFLLCFIPLQSKFNKNIFFCFLCNVKWTVIFTQGDKSRC